MRIPIAVIGAAVVVLISACDTNRISDPSAGRADKEPSGIVPIGTDPLQLNSQFGFNIVGIPDDDYQIRAILGMARQAGFKFVRGVISWADYQPSNEGMHDGWISYFDTVIRAISDSGLTPIISIVETPCWARAGTWVSDETGTHCYIRPEDGAGDTSYSRYEPPHPAFWWHYQNFWSQIVARYPGVTYWGIGNEPNIKYFSPMYGTDVCASGDWLAAYDLAFRYAEPVIKNAGRVIVAPHLGRGFTACGERFDASFARFVDLEGFRMRSQDVYAVHHYGDLADFVADLNAYNTKLNGVGAPNDIWVTEIGYSEWELDYQVQAYTNTGFFKGLLEGAYPPRVTKLFKWHLFETAYRVLDVSYDPYFSISARPVYACLQALARWWTVPDYCTRGLH